MFWLQSPLSRAVLAIFSNEYDPGAAQHISPVRLDIEAGRNSIGGSDCHGDDTLGDDGGWLDILEIAAASRPSPSSSAPAWPDDRLWAEVLNIGGFQQTLRRQRNLQQRKTWLGAVAAMLSCAAACLVNR